MVFKLAIFCPFFHYEICISYSDTPPCWKGRSVASANYACARCAPLCKPNKYIWKHMFSLEETVRFFEAAPLLPKQAESETRDSDASLSHPHPTETVHLWAPRHKRDQYHGRWRYMGNCYNLGLLFQLASTTTLAKRSKANLSPSAKTEVVQAVEDQSGWERVWKQMWQVGTCSGIWAEIALLEGGVNY